MTAHTPTTGSPTATGPVELTVVIPCLNEAETLAVCVDKARGAIASMGITGEVVVADNGSSDGSREIAEVHGARVVRVAVRGYGAALQAGIRAAQGEYVIMADGDDSYALDDLEPFVEALRGGADLVMGNRFAGGIAPGAMPPLHRYVGNPVLSFIGRRMFRVPVGDFHCGMRGFRRDRVLDLDLTTTGMEFASEMVVRSAVSGLDIAEVPTKLRPDGRSRRPHLRTWRDGWRHLRFLLTLSPRWLLLYPGLALVLVGGVAFGVLAAGPVTIGGVTFDVQTMTAAATALVVGLQAVGLAVVSRAMAARYGLLPPSRRLDRWSARLPLEVGMAVGGVLGLLGLAAFVVAVLRWQDRSFGRLATDDMRLPLLGLLLVVAGAQVLFVSFLLALTRLGDRD
jgi:Glycosyl transferase family 2